MSRLNKYASATALSSATILNKRREMTWKDHLVMLLHIGAEIEHSLMVQYLYAAYSLGGEQVPHRRRAMVRRWQEDILAVAREEMGHLLTVQNILTLIGGPINLGRLNLPWDIPFYPFPFKLEPVSLDSIACYVYAEMPSEQEFAKAGKLLERYRKFEERDLPRVTKLATSRDPKRGAHRVGSLYQQIVELLSDSTRIPDHEFHESTFVFQASSDDWGRGYQPPPQMLDAEGSLDGAAKVREASMPVVRQAHVMVDRMATRSQAVAALIALSHQGEAPVLATTATDEPSHFDRFLGIYQEYNALTDKHKWQPARAVPTNPATLWDPDAPNDGYISHLHSQEWASLFNLRYRMLLKYLAHTFQLARTAAGDTPNLRAMVMHRVFGEMYNLKTIAGILVGLPRRDAEKDPARAGPPFEMPYTLDMPGGELERWILHRDLIRSSQRLCSRLAAHPHTSQGDYLNTLIGLDSQTDTWIGRILAGLAGAERMTP
jgi:hypothetical protein